MAISRFSKFFKHPFLYEIEAQLEVSLGKNFIINNNREKEIEAKNCPNFPRFQILAYRHGRCMVIVRMWSSVGQNKALCLANTK